MKTFTPDDLLNTKNELFSAAVKTALQNTKVPAKMFLQVVSELHQSHHEHKQDRNSWRDTVGRVSQYFKKNAEDRLQHQEEIKALHARHADEMRALKESHTKVFAEQGKETERIQKIKEGKPGLPGKDANHEQIVSMLVERDLIPKGDKGDPGDDADFDKEALFKEFITLIRKNKLITAEHVQGLQGWVRDGVKYRYEELMHGGGGAKTYFANTSGTGTITGAVNGSNTTYTLPAGVPTNAKVFADGARQISSGDYTRLGTSLVFVVAPISNVVVDG